MFYFGLTLLVMLLKKPAMLSSEPRIRAADSLMRFCRPGSLNALRSESDRIVVLPRNDAMCQSPTCDFDLAANGTSV